MCRSRINLRGMPKLNRARRQRVRADADSRRPNCTGACSCAGSSLRASVSWSSAEPFDVSDRWDVPTCEARAPRVAHRWSGANLIAGASYGRPPSVGACSYDPFHGSASFESVVPPQPFSLEDAARGTDVRELAQPMPVHAWFHLPDRLIRRDDAVARSMTRDAVWVEAGCGETKLAAWVWRSSVRHRQQVNVTSDPGSESPTTSFSNGARANKRRGGAA